MSCKDIYNVIKYAVEIEGHSIQFKYGLGKYFRNILSHSINLWKIKTIKNRMLNKLIFK